jgi:simple sugar transport system ATP-binding protein
LAIARALYLGARVLILDEPTSSLGVREAGTVLRLITQAKARGVGVVFITHNAHHALSVGDRFTVLIRGVVAADLHRSEARREEILDLMAGGEEMDALSHELAAAEDANS